MSQENTVSFKVFLQKNNPGEKPEVRRFGIDRDVVSNFSYLKEKLQAVFPALRSKDIVVSWKDDEGDEIIISSDDELIIALTEMQGDVRKLYVTASDVSQNTNFSAFLANAPPCRIVCDGCDKAVEGFCYKCIQCPDFDLCASCEGKRMHPEHFMVRSSFPISLRPQLGRRLAHHLSKASRKACRNTLGECPRRDQRHSAGNVPLIDSIESWFSALLNAASGGQENQEQSQKEACAASSQNQNANATAKDSKQEDRHVNYLMNVGKTVAEMLEPLGIDVEVSVSDAKKNKNATKVDEQKSPQKEKSVNVHIDKNEAAESEKFDTAPSQAQGDVKHDENKTEAMETPLPQADRESPEKDGWTVLNKEIQNQLDDNIPVSEKKEEPAAETKDKQHEDIHMAAHRTALAATQAMAQVMSGAIPRHNVPVFHPPPNPFGQQRPVWAPYPMPPTNVYPPLPTNPMMHMQSQIPAPQQLVHGNPKIADAVNKMMAMGFSNEGGWLTQLLEIKNGDIEKALDVLQPVKK